MRSSDRSKPWHVPLEVACAAALIACTALPATAPLAADAGAVQCSMGRQALSPARAAELSALRRSIEANPLYAAVAAGRAARCTVGGEGSRWEIAYRFGADSALNVTRDSAIEYTDYAATVAWPPGTDALSLLARSERAAFAPEGCGIDWQRPETLTSSGASPGRVSVWRGDTCNCQGRVVEDAAGRIVGVGLRSAC